ncbi:MAG: FG-GAP-like repeat-containing protein [bacterium]
MRRKLILLGLAVIFILSLPFRSMGQFKSFAGDSDNILSSRSSGNGFNETQAMHSIALNGLSAGENFGYSVAPAGDINGDGYSDMIIGAPEYGSDGGRIFVFLGGSVPDNHYDIKINGGSNTNAATSVSTMGDFNGDGYDDYMSAAPSTTTNNGRVWGYWGSENPSGVYDINFENLQTAELFGKSIACAGDFNGDGYDDIIIGAPASGNGRAYIFLGGATPNDVVDVTLTGEASADFFGCSVSSAGDVNGDGYDDVIVGAYLNDAGASSGGRAYIFFGGASMNNVVDKTLTGTVALGYLGVSVSSAGDINGDGYSDVIVGEYGHDNTATNEGAAYIYYGGASMDNTADVHLYGFSDSDYFGVAVSGGGDVNGDGFDDVVIGAHYNDAGGSNAGRAYIFFGGTGISGIPNKILTGEAENDNFGYAAAFGGDVNGDGYDDVLIGAYKNDNNGTDCGRAYLYLSSLTGNDIPDEFFTGSVEYDHLGSSVSSAGDVNGDGFDDIIIGAPNKDYSTTETGKAYIYFGGEGMDNLADITLTGVNAFDVFGSSVAGAGDLNGDGYDDVIVGAPGFDYTGTDDGRAYIFYGSTSMNSTVDVTLTGETAGDKFGTAVSTAGDVNGDGFYDVIVGARGFDDGSIFSAGRAYIYLGGSSMNNVADVTTTGSGGADGLGGLVATAGDVNGDGYDDIIVGATESASGPGYAYVLFGGTNMDNNTDLQLDGSANYDLFGKVSSAGDVNGDGFDDLLVGAPANDDGGTGNGKGYIYLGGISMDNIADITFSDVGNGLGSGVSSAGDVNNDGYDDVILGSESDHAYIYFGGAIMDNSVDISLTGNTENESFGWAVSKAGDINRDGFDDVIIGASGNDVGGTNAGRAYLFLSSAPSSIPRILSVDDIGYDEGGYVDINFIRSACDSREVNTITEYQIHRSNPPGQTGFSWSLAGTVNPSQDLKYTYVAVTPNDSMTNNSGTYFYRVTAVNSTGEIWKSNIVSGHSVDNLAPDAPEGAAANRSGYNVVLTWDENTEGDLKQYLVYRNSSSPLPGDAVPIATTISLTYTDTSPLEEMVYYFIKAEDIHANKSAATETNLDVYLGANVKVFLQGCYSSGSMTTTLNSSGYIPFSQPYNASPWSYAGTESVTSIPSGVVDWVLVELRSNTTTVAGKRAGFLKSDGTITDTDGSSQLKFSGLNSGDYYVVIRHRNHLAIMTANKVTLTNNSSQYNFSSAQTQAYGTNAMKDLGSGVYGTYSADANGNGQIQNNDSEDYWKIQNGQSGYKSGDFNLNGQVQNNDREDFFKSNNGKGTQVPASTMMANPILTNKNKGE